MAERYQQTNPSDYRGYYYLAAAREHEEEQRPVAEALLRKAIGLNPDFAASHTLLGKLLVRDDRASEAVLDLERAVQLRPGYQPAHLYLGNAYRKLGRRADADREFQKLRELNDKEGAEPRLRYHRGSTTNSPQ